MPYATSAKTITCVVPNRLNSAPEKKKKGTSPTVVTSREMPKSALQHPGTARPRQAGIMRQEGGKAHVARRTSRKHPDRGDGDSMWPQHSNIAHAQ